MRAGQTRPPWQPAPPCHPPCLAWEGRHGRRQGSPASQTVPLRHGILQALEDSGSRSRAVAPLSGARGRASKIARRGRRAPKCGGSGVPAPLAVIAWRHHRSGAASGYAGQPHRHLDACPPLAYGRISSRPHRANADIVAIKAGRRPPAWMVCRLRRQPEDRGSRGVFLDSAGCIPEQASATAPPVCARSREAAGWPPSGVAGSPLQGSNRHFTASGASPATQGTARLSTGWIARSGKRLRCLLPLPWL